MIIKNWKQTDLTYKVLYSKMLYLTQNYRNKQENKK